MIRNNITEYINVTNTEYLAKIEKVNKDNETYSHLILRKININMSGTIVCTASNNLNNSSQTETVNLKVRSIAFALALFLLFTCQVALICVAILIIEKKRVKKDKENDKVFVQEKF